MNDIDIFNQINFSEVNIDPPVIYEDKMVVKIHNVELVSDIDNCNHTTRYIKSAFLTFIGVGKSTRKINEYIGDPKKDGFKDEYILEDVVIIKSNLENKEIYEFEGVLSNPLAWVGEWIIYCDSFQFIEAYDI